MDDIAVYITTTASDYYLAKVLAWSVKHYSPQTPVYLLPDDDYKGSHLFGFPTWRPSDPRVLELDGYCTKLRAFWGPAERFVYLDADMLFLKDPSKLLAEVATRNGPFLMACAQTKWMRFWKEAAEEEKRSEFDRWIGKISLIEEFDPSFDWKSWTPFNGGFVAAHRDVLDRDRLLDTYLCAERFHAHSKPKRKLTSSRDAMLNGDQGILQYYLAKTGVHVEFLDDVYVWGGDKELWRQRASLPGPYAGLLIHWAGCPRPGLIRRRVPGGVEWRKHYLNYCISRSDFGGLLRDGIREALHLSKERASKVKRAVFSRRD